MLSILVAVIACASALRSESELQKQALTVLSITYNEDTNGNPDLEKWIKSKAKGEDADIILACEQEKKPNYNLLGNSGIEQVGYKIVKRHTMWGLAGGSLNANALTIAVRDKMLFKSKKVKKIRMNKGKKYKPGKGGFVVHAKVGYQKNSRLNIMLGCAHLPTKRTARSFLLSQFLNQYVQGFQNTKHVMGMTTSSKSVVPDAFIMGGDFNFRPRADMGLPVDVNNPETYAGLMDQDHLTGTANNLLEVAGASKMSFTCNTPQIPSYKWHPKEDRPWTEKIYNKEGTGWNLAHNEEVQFGMLDRFCGDDAAKESGVVELGSSFSDHRPVFGVRTIEKKNDAQVGANTMENIVEALATDVEKDDSADPDADEVTDEETLNNLLNKEAEEDSPLEADEEND